LTRVYTGETVSNLDDRMVRCDQQGNRLFSTHAGVAAIEIPIVDSYKYLGSFPRRQEPSRGQHCEQAPRRLVIMTFKIERDALLYSRKTSCNTIIKAVKSTGTLRNLDLEIIVQTQAFKRHLRTREFRSRIFSANTFPSDIAYQSDRKSELRDLRSSWRGELAR